MRHKKEQEISGYFAKVASVCLLALLLSCNITYKIRNQHYNIEEVVHFPCGKVSIELLGKGNSKFLLKQQFDLDADATVFIDSLRIYYNEKPVAAKHNFKIVKRAGGGLEMENNKTFESAFEFDRGVFEGDTIMLWAQGYLHCQNKIFNLDTLIYSFTNNLRIYGVND